MNYRSLQVCCIDCRKETKIPGLHNHYNRMHGTDEELKKRALFSNLVAAEKAKIKAVEKHLKECKEYSSDPRFCQSCNNEIDFFRKNNKYCTPSCGATNSNKAKGPKSAESKRKTSESMKGRTSKSKGLPGVTKRYCFVFFHKCTQCDFIIISKGKSAKRKTCSRCGTKRYCFVFFHKCTQCDFIIISKGKSAKRKTCSRECQIHASVGVRPYTNGKRLNIYYTKKDQSVVLLESSWEEKLAKQLDSLDIEWIRPKPIRYILDNKSKLYYPDFFLPGTGLYIDPKNPYVLKLSLDKMNIVSNLIPLWYGDIKCILDSIPSVKVVGFEPATRKFAPAG